KWDVHNFTMGFQRQVTDDAWEYLLLNGEESFNERGEPEWVFSPVRYRPQFLPTHSVD
ncbi:YjfK family protein, partial [Salmonella enterica subsp. enterica serovar Anatum]|nr:YjfK family protein [Salmonella enterica subsp. enterica serovar Anatum]